MLILAFQTVITLPQKVPLDSTGLGFHTVMPRTVPVCKEADTSGLLKRRFEGPNPRGPDLVNLGQALKMSTFLQSCAGDSHTESDLTAGN